MHEPPTPHVSGARWLLVLYLRVKYFFYSQRLRRRWQLHRLKRQAARTPGSSSSSFIPLSGTRVEDMINLPTEMDTPSARYKPLLIASFNNGCSRTPTLQYLTKNKGTLSKFRGGKHRLCQLDPTNFKARGKCTNLEHQHDHVLPCAAAVHSLRETAGKHADIKVVFHDRNTIRVTNLRSQTERPSQLKFDSANIVDLKQFASLRIT